ncbi:MAG: glutamate--tRNA ligase, partial [bacterium]|nr:glutamate--tRNA ligase [bacterium]
ARYFFTDEIQPDPKAAEQWLTEKHRGMLKQLHDKLATVNPFTEEGLKTAFEAVLVAHNEKMKELAQPVRVALTGNTISPGIFELMLILGRERTLKRIQQVT